MMLRHRLLTVINVNYKSCSFVTAIPKWSPAIQKQDFPATQIESAIRKYPELQNFSIDLWQRTFDTLIAQGFNASSFMKIVGKRPEVLRRSPERLVESIECLRVTQFGDKNVVELIENHPELLEYNNSYQLQKKMVFLKTYAKTQRNVFLLFLSSPNLITDPDAVTQKKIDYLTNVMKADETDVSKSTVFTRSLDEIKCRHVFLSRLGMFKPRNPKVDKLEPSKNPKMCYIYDTSDREFAVKTCGVTLEEFETFRELYRREKHRDEDEFDDEE